jgi:hypothetical protein
MATFIVRIQEEHAEVIKDSMELLLALLREWISYVNLEAITPGMTASSLSGIHRLEGAALVLLASNTTDIRR